MFAPVDAHRLSSDGAIFRHTGDPRMAATATLAAMIVALFAGAVLAFGVPPQYAALNPQSIARVSPPAAAPSGPVRVVGAKTTTPADIPCNEQTWPYIDQRCLVRSEATPATDPKPATPLTKSSAKSLATSLATPDNAKLSPVSAAGHVGVAQPAQPASQPAPQAETTGSAPAERAVALVPPRPHDAFYDSGQRDALANDGSDDDDAHAAPPPHFIEPGRHAGVIRSNGARFGYSYGAPRRRHSRHY